MRKVLTDQNFDGPTFRGLLLRIRDLDVVRTEDIGLKGFEDPDILAWAAEEDRLILTHDARTFPQFAFERMARAKKFSGLVIVPRNLSIRRAIEDLMIIILCSADGEPHDTFVRLPM